MTIWPCMHTIIVSSGNDCVCVLIKGGLFEGNLFWVGQYEGNLSWDSRYDPSPPPLASPSPNLHIGRRTLIQY